VDVLRKMIEAVEPGGLVLDLQVIRPNPVVEAGTEVLCEIDGEWLFAMADAATAAIDSEIAGRRLVEEAVDVHDVRKHYAGGADIVDDFAGKKRKVPLEAVRSVRGPAGGVPPIPLFPPMACATRLAEPVWVVFGLPLICPSMDEPT
jgi:hypothetical protein